jgi:hypothetical protein
VIFDISSPRFQDTARTKSQPGYSLLQLLPAWFARLSRGFAIIFVGEASAATATITPPAAPAASTTATPTASTATPSATTSWRTTRTSTTFFRARFIHFPIAPAKIFSVKPGDRLAGFFIVRHFHERESARTARFAIHHHVNARHLSEWLERCANFTLSRLKAHVTHEEILHPNSPEVR